MKIILILCLSVVACGPEQVPVAEVKNYVGRGFQLVATPGEHGGYCILMEDAHSDRVELLTPEGALSGKQVGDAVGYMGYLEQTVTGSVPTVMGITTLLALAKKSKWSFSLLILTGVTVGANIGYRYLRGWFEGEGKEAIRAQAWLGFLPANLLVEYLQRKSRVDRFLDRYKRIGHDTDNDRKNNNVVRRIVEMRPAYAGGCDQVKESLKSITAAT